MQVKRSLKCDVSHFFLYVCLSYCPSDMPSNIDYQEQTELFLVRNSIWRKCVLFNKKKSIIRCV